MKSSQTVEERINGKPGTYRDLPLCVALGVGNLPIRKTDRVVLPLKSK